MDNRKISIQSCGRKDFDLSFELVFNGAPGRRATHYLDHPEKGFVLLWSEANLSVCGQVKPALALPFKMAWKECADMAWGWLSEQPEERYEDYLDHDGSNGKGFRIYNEDWAGVAGSNYGILAVQPIWTWYGK